MCWLYFHSVFCVLSIPCAGEKISVGIKWLGNFEQLSSETQATRQKEKHHSTSCLSTDMTYLLQVEFNFWKRYSWVGMSCLVRFVILFFYCKILDFNENVAYFTLFHLGKVPVWLLVLRSCFYCLKEGINKSIYQVYVPSSTVEIIFIWKLNVFNGSRWYLVIVTKCKKLEELTLTQFSYTITFDHLISDQTIVMPSVERN